MRRTMTAAERRALVLLQWLHIPVQAQVVCGPYIADFVGLDRNFILEIDGPFHAQQRAYDQKRDAFFRAVGFVVIRIENDSLDGELLSSELWKCEVTTPQKVKARIWYASMLANYWTPKESADALKRLSCAETARPCAE